MGKAAKNPITGLSGVIQKPNLLPCKEDVISTCNAKQQKFDMRTDLFQVTWEVLQGTEMDA